MIGFLFFCFAGLVVLSSIAVIISSNPVYAVLSLIFTFFVSSAVFMLLGAELVAMLLVIVYVGAVAVLFLFVVMMLDLDCVRSSHGLVRYYPLGVGMAAVLFGCSAYAVLHSRASFREVAEFSVEHSVGNVFLIGSKMYTEYFYAFQMSGILLLVAAVGTLILTLRRNVAQSHKQDVKDQVARSSRVELRSPDVGKGVEEADC